MWYLLSRNPEVEAKLHAEIDAAVGDRPITVEALGRLPYLEMVVKESMRILPSVWTYMRAPLEDIWLGGRFIPKGATVMISPYITAHDERFFQDPDVFRPERFTSEAEAALPKGAYTPFAGGRRACMGAAFAMMESRIILGTFVQRLHAKIPDIDKPEWTAQLSLTPKGGLPSVVRLRDTTPASQN